MQLTVIAICRSTSRGCHAQKQGERRTDAPFRRHGAWTPLDVDPYFGKS